jgi:hypothetical protein
MWFRKKVLIDFNAEGLMKALKERPSEFRRFGEHADRGWIYHDTADLAIYIHRRWKESTISLRGDTAINSVPFSLIEKGKELDGVARQFLRDHYNPGEKYAWIIKIGEAVRKFPKDSGE